MSAGTGICRSSNGSASGPDFSLPLLLIGHIVTTRLATTVYHVEPSYHVVVASLMRSGTQGWQIALLAPGWVHGCLGLWIGLRRIAFMRRIRPALIGCVILMPLLSAIGFLEMGRSISTAAGVEGNATASRAAALVPWREAIMAAYLALIAGAFVAGRLQRSR